VPQISRFYNGTENHFSWGERETIFIKSFGIDTSRVPQSEHP